MGKEDSFSGFMSRRFSVLQGLRVVFLHDIMGVKSLCNRLYAFRGINCVVNFNPVCQFRDDLVLVLCVLERKRNRQSTRISANRIPFPRLLRRDLSSLLVLLSQTLGGMLDSPSGVD